MNQLPRLAVLGSMGELGHHAAALHREIGIFTQAQGVEFLIAAGPHADAYAAGAREAGLQNVLRVLDAEEATAALTGLLRVGDAVLVKGSHFMGLEKLVETLSGKKGA